MMIVRFFKQSVCVLALCLIVFSCGNNQPVGGEFSFDFPEEQLPCSISFVNNIDDSAQALPDNLVSQILRNLKKHEGTQAKIQTPIPESWTVEYKLTPMSSDFDIWILSNLRDATHKILATVTTTETPSVIQSVLVAYSAANEKKNHIESEQWTAVVKEDYTIVVEKLYEKIYSLSDMLSHDESTSSKVEDVYIIENNGKIRYEIPVTYNIDYRAIVQFADTASIGNILNEDWIWNSIEIQEEVEPVGILFTTATKNFGKLSICNYHGEVIDVVDLSSFLEKHNMGYILLKKGQKPAFIPYASAKEILPKAFKHFGLEYEIEPELEETPELSSIY